MRDGAPLHSAAREADGAGATGGRPPASPAAASAAEGAEEPLALAAVVGLDVALPEGDGELLARRRRRAAAKLSEVESISNLERNDDEDERMVLVGRPSEEAMTPISAGKGFARGGHLRGPSRSSSHSEDLAAGGASYWDLTIRQALTGELLAHVKARPTDPVSRVAELALRASGEAGVSAQLLFHTRILDSRALLRDTGVVAGDTVSVVLKPWRCLTASMDGTARIRHLQSGVQLKFELGTSLWNAVLAPGGSMLLMLSTEGEGSLWCAETGVPLIKLREGIQTCDFSPDGARFAGATDELSAARIWCAETGECLLTLFGHADDVKSAVFSPFGDLVATASSDHTARLWAADTGECIAVLAGHSDVVKSVAFSPDGNLLVTASMDRTARIWSVASRVTRHALVGHRKALESACFSPDGRKVLTTSHDGTAGLWDVEAGQRLLTLRGDALLVRCAVFSPDGSHVLVASGGTRLRLFSAETGECCVTMPPQKSAAGHTDHVKTVCFSPDGALVASASFDGDVRIWSTVSGECQQTLAGHTEAVVATGLVAV